MLAPISSACPWPAPTAAKRRLRPLPRRRGRRRCAHRSPGPPRSMRSAALSVAAGACRAGLPACAGASKRPPATGPVRARPPTASRLRRHGRKFRVRPLASWRAPSGRPTCRGLSGGPLSDMKTAPVHTADAPSRGRTQNVEHPVPQARYLHSGPSRPDHRQSSVDPVGRGGHFRSGGAAGLRDRWVHGLSSRATGRCPAVDHRRGGGSDESAGPAKGSGCRPRRRHLAMRRRHPAGGRGRSSA